MNERLNSVYNIKGFNKFNDQYNTIYKSHKFFKGRFETIANKVGIKEINAMYLKSLKGTK